MSCVGRRFPLPPAELEALRSGSTVADVSDLDRPENVQDSEFGRLLQFLVATGVRPVIDRTIPLADAADGFAAMIGGELFGKVVLEPGNG